MPSNEDLFTPVHKGLRAMLNDLASRVQTNDFADAASTSALIADLHNDFAIARSSGCVLCILAHHAEDEEGLIFADVAPKAGPLIQGLIADHRELTRRELEIGRAAQELLAMPAPADRVAAGIRLNQMTNELFAHYMVHMNREETDLVPLMRGHFTDAQMAAMRGAIIGRLPPDRLFAILRWMLPALNVSELCDLLQIMRPSAPPEAFRAIVGLCAERVPPARWAEAKRRAGL